MFMKKYTFLLSFFISVVSYGQQISLNSQYLFNEMFVNPAATGIKEYIPVQFNFRKQWTAFPGSPTTQAISANSAIFKKMGFGGTLFNDVCGPSRRTGIQLNTAYHLQLDHANSHTLGLGLGISLTQHMIDVNQLVTYLPDDPAVLRGYNNQMVPDANFGVFYRYKNKAFVGLSAYNLAEMKRDLYDFENPLINPLIRTYYMFGGYNFDLSKDFDLNTSCLLQGIETGAIQFDLTAIGVYKDFLWLGASYRHQDAIAAIFGGQIGMFKLGYSYDYTLSDIGDYSYGSHEILLEIQLNSSKSAARTPWLKRNRIYSPE